MTRPLHEIGSDNPPRAAEVEPPASTLVIPAGGSATHACSVTAALQRAWEATPSLPAIDFTDAEASALAAALHPAAAAQEKFVGNVDAGGRVSTGICEPDAVADGHGQHGGLASPVEALEQCARVARDHLHGGKHYDRRHTVTTAILSIEHEIGALAISQENDR